MNMEDARDKRMKFVVCGTLVPVKFETKIEKLSNAGNRFIFNFCKSLLCKNELSVLSFIGVPVEKNIREEIIHEKADFSIEYFFSYENRLKNLFQYMKRVKKELQKADCIIAYNAVYAWFCAPYLAKYMKKKSLLILADYSPAYSYESVLRKIYAYFQLRVIRKYDCVVGLSQNSENYLKKKQKFLCIEGGIDQDFYDYFNIPYQANDKVIRFMYAGILEPVTGIEQLIRAFRQIQKKEIQLLISGKGSLKGMVEEASQKDERITYLGCMPYSDYMDHLKNADVLVNPRDMMLPENQYNFPSKILEYLATGKPILSTKFPGWEKFSEQLMFCESSIEDIRENIEKICENRQEDELVRFERNRRFAEQFIWSKQIDKVMEEIKNI